MKAKLRSILSGWVIHALLVQVIVFLGYVVRYVDHLPYKRKSPWEYFIIHTFYRPDMLAMVLALLLIEISYHFFFKEFNIGLFLLICVATGVSGCAILTLLNYGSPEQHILQPDLILYFTGYTFLYAVARDYIYRFRHKNDIQLQQSKSELDALKAQLNPHFLFNSLNYLYGTALREKADETADGIDQLSEMMRYTITGIHENFVPLERELKFIERYLKLQKARLPKNENIRIDVQLPSTIPLKQIAPLLFLPFIENAFKYGISMDEPCFVKIAIGITDNRISLNITNSIVSKFFETKGNNTGIRNTIKRLELLYPNRFELQQTNSGKQFEIKLFLTLQS